MTALPTPPNADSRLRKRRNAIRRTSSINTTPYARGTLTAAATRLTSEQVDRKETARDADWQAEAWDMYDLVGELHFVANALAEQVGKAKLYIGHVSEEDDAGEPEPVDRGSVFNVLHYFTPTAVERSQLLKRYALNNFIAGEGWIVGIPEYLLTKDQKTPKSLPDGLESLFPEEDNLGALDDLRWRFLSHQEVTINNDRSVTLTLPEAQVSASAEECYLIEIRDPHPRNASEADSPTRAALPILRELVGLTQHVSAQIDSRLAGAGLLAVSQTVLDAMKDQENPDAPSGDSVFMESLMEAMVTPISDRDSASALVPLLVGVPDLGEKAIGDFFHHLSFANNLDQEARELREEAIRRLALSIDAPPELLLGVGSMNHWGAWLVKEETITGHVEPPLMMLCDALTREFLWPVLREAGLDESEIQNHVVWYSVTHLIARPNRTKDALSLFDADAIDADALRREAGFGDEDKPEEGESMDVEVSLALDMLKNAPSLASDPGLDVLVAQIKDALQGTDEAPKPASNDSSDEESDDDADGDNDIPDTDDDDPQEGPASD